MNATQPLSTPASPAPVTAFTLAMACALAMSGCASSPSPAPILLSLPPAVASLASSAVTEAPPAAGAGSPRLLAIRRVGIPEYLVARRVRYRSDASTLAEWPNTYWAERIEIGVSREFMSALRQQLPGWELCESTCGDREPSLALQVDMVPMDFLRSAQQLQARARITVSSAGAAPRTLQATELTYALPAAADTAQAQAGAVTELLRRVAAATAPLVNAAQK
jgi:uncharacterized lipoprotein YmbA